MLVRIVTDVKKIIYLWMLTFLGFNASAGILAQFRTRFGDIDVELFEDKPVTVQNFLRYVESGAYQNMFLHRCIPGFVVQGGGYWIGNPTSTNFFSPTNRNVLAVHNFGAITNEFNVGKRQTNSFGTIAMAKLGGDPNSASSEWFFNLADNSANLDSQNGGFTVFGRAVHGTNVLAFFNTLNKSTALGIQDMTRWLGVTNGFGQLFSDLPVSYAGFVPPRYTNLVYVYDISLLKVQVQALTNKTQQISWNPIAGRTNYTVEFTTNLPPSWNELTTTNGTGATLKVVDANTNLPRRFYRVRVEY